HQAAATPHVLLASRGNAMSVFGVPALAVVHGAVEHEVGGAVAGQHFKAPCGLFDVLMRGPAQGRGLKPLLFRPHQSPPEAVQATHLGRDRKSTRLNSSHVAISYAVFCVKTRN